MIALFVPAAPVVITRGGARAHPRVCLVDADFAGVVNNFASIIVFLVRADRVSKLRTPAGAALVLAL